MEVKNNTVFDCNIINFSKVDTENGNITVVENDGSVPFDVKRVYYLYDIPGGEFRGGHSHYELEQIVFAASGSFDVILDDGKYKKRVSLNRPHLGLYIKAGLWRELDNFSAGSICMVLASQVYKKEDYIRDYNIFKKKVI